MTKTKRSEHERFRMLAGWLAVLVLLGGGSLFPLTLTVSYNTGGLVKSVAWHPSGQYLACGANAGETDLQVLAFNGTSLTLVDVKSFGSVVESVAWSPDGNYLAVAGTSPISGMELQIYAFNGTALSLVTGYDYGTMLFSVDWSPDGNYLAIGGYAPPNGKELKILAFSGTTLTLVTDWDYGSMAFMVDWSPEGGHLVVGGSRMDAGKELRVLAFNGTSLVWIADLDYGNNVQSAVWSPDGRRIAVAGVTPRTGHEDVEVIGFDGSALTILAQYDYGNSAVEVSWSGAPWRFALGGAYLSAGYEFQVVQNIDWGSSFEMRSDGRLDHGESVNSVHWASGTCWIAMGGNPGPDGMTVRVLKFDEDSDCDGILDDWDGLGDPGAHPCPCNQRFGCDDSYPASPNPTQCPVEIGDRVWHDANGNGLQDSGEQGLSEIMVLLYSGTGGYRGYALTDFLGRYRFGMGAGQYILQFVQPPGGIFTAQGIGGDPQADSDADPMTGQTAIINSVAGTFMNSIDAGLVPGCTAPDEEIWIYAVDKSGVHPILNYEDPNQPAQRTGYNIYRTGNPSKPQADWLMLGSNVVDMDAGKPNYQYTDSTGATGTLYYKVTAYHALCDAEGPF